LRAQQRQRVAAQGEAGGGVVVGDGFALPGFDQRQGQLVGGRVEAQGLAVEQAARKAGRLVALEPALLT
jgi:hypothetical protein